MKIHVLALVFLLFATSFATAQNVMVMTYNIRLDIASDGENSWSNRREFLTSQIAFHAPDVFGVQEALPNQMDDLARLLPQYANFGTGRDGEGKGEASAIFYKKDRFTVSRTATFWLSDTPAIVSKGWDASHIRICTYGLFRDRRTGRSFWFFNTHLDNNGATARRKGIELILARIKTVNTKALPVVFTGDFNAEPESDLLVNLKQLMTDSREVSEQKPFGPNGSFNGFRYNEPVTRLIDYIFVDNSKRLAVKKYAVLSDSINLRFPSDHFPVIAELEYRKK